MLSRVRALTAAGHPRDGPHRPDAADGDDARRLQGSGPERRQGGEALRGRAGAAGRRLLRARARGRARHRSRRGSRTALEIPTIGIGAGAGCDGQVLVWHDLLGLYHGRAPRFVKQYAELAPVIGDAIARVRRRGRGRARFPDEQHTYAMSDDELALFEERLAEARSGVEDPERARGTATAIAVAAAARGPASSRARRARRSRAARPTTTTNTRSIPAKTCPPAPESLPPVRKRSSP